jgi:transcriptional regulator with XRE-family HTH domain
VIFMKNVNFLPERLKTERTRLKMSQADAADCVGVSREMWGKYERGLSQPGVDVFSSFVDAGADVNFLVTGAYLTVTTATSEEAILLTNYRNASAEGRSFIRHACAMAAAGNTAALAHQPAIDQSMHGDGIQIGGNVSGTVAITNTTPKRKPRNAS